MEDLLIIQGTIHDQTFIPNDAAKWTDALETFTSGNNVVLHYKDENNDEIYRFIDAYNQAELCLSSDDTLFWFK